MKSHSRFVCQQCQYVSASYLGRCPQCGTWGSLVEELDTASSTGAPATASAVKAEKLATVSSRKFERVSTGFGEFDRVLGTSIHQPSTGGIVVGSVTLLAGDPGIGKSTLLLQIAARVAAKNPKSYVLYVSGEESSYQIKLRADRLVAIRGTKIPANLEVLTTTDIDATAPLIESTSPALTIVDSIQTMQVSDLSGMAGSVGQVRESTMRLFNVAKRVGTPIFVVGHVTKEGMIAGPKVLEHIVDVVLQLEGGEGGVFRILRSTKNRFGATSEVGIFEMTEAGMKEVANPSSLFLSEKKTVEPGQVVTVTLTGARPIVVEIQALVSPTLFGLPRRVATGIDFQRLQIILAVLSRKLQFPIASSDVYVNVVGGMRLSEPAADLAVALAIASAATGKIVPQKTVVIGEIGLLGEIRKVSQMTERLKAAHKIGFTGKINPEDFSKLSQVFEKYLK